MKGRPMLVIAEKAQCVIARCRCSDWSSFVVPTCHWLP